MTVKLNQQLRRVEISSFEVKNDVVFNYFDALPTSEREEKLLKALHIGVLALMEDRFSAFLAKTTNDLGVELESLKMIFDLKQEIFQKTAIKGILAEDEVASFLEEFFADQRLKDTVHLTGTAAGSLPKNKTGDIVCKVGGDDGPRIVIECKFDKSLRLGDIASKDIFTRKTDTVWSQLIEAQANRDAKVGMIVLDRSLIDASVLNAIQNVRFLPEVGFVAIIDSQKGDFSNLAIAYMLARDIAINAKPIELDKNLLAAIVNRLVSSLDDILKIKSLVEGNIENNKKILLQLEKAMLFVKFNQEFLLKFLADGSLTKEDFLSFYTGEAVMDRYKPIEKEIKEI